MKIRPITIVIIIGSVLMVAFSVTIIKNKSIKKEKSVSDIQNVKNEYVSSEKVSKSQKEKVQDVYEHLMDEDWEYIWNKIEHYENEILTIEDLKYYFKSEIKKSDVDEGNLKLDEQGYTLGEIIIQDDEYGDLVVFSISNGNTEKCFGLYEKGSSKEQYVLLLDTDFSSRDYVGGEKAKYRGNAVIFPKELENIKIRGVKLDDKYIDETFFDSVNDIEELESSINENEKINDYSNYKVYRLVLPMKTLTFNEEIANMSKDEFGVDVGNPGKLLVTADSKYGRVYSPEGITLDSYGTDDFILAKYGFTAKLYLDSNEGRDIVLNGLKDTLNGIIKTYEETGTYLSDDYRKFFVNEFSDEGYKEVTETLQEALGDSDSKWDLKKFNRRVDGVVSSEKGIEYLGNNIFSFVPGTATIWEQETGFQNETNTKTCQNISNNNIIVEIQDDGTIKIKEVYMTFFKGLCLMSSDFEWEY